MIGVLSSGIARIPFLSTFLGEEWAFISRWQSTPPAGLTAIAGWGHRPTAKRARIYARKHGVQRYVSLEDGFLRSVALGQSAPPLSIVLDDVGVHYDATAPSRLEDLIQAQRTPEERARARSLIAQWRTAGVSKYNHLRDPDPHAINETGERLYAFLDAPFVLVADQTPGDASITFGLADVHSFGRMLAAALEENPDKQVVVKIHPAVMSGGKKGHFDVPALMRNPRITVLAQDVHPAALIRHADAVYVVSSQMGFEGLLWGKPVHTFGMPFYGGFGLTQDALPAPSRRQPVCLEDLVYAALIAYPRYVDPETGARCEPERIIAWMEFQRRMRARFAPRLYAIGFSRWKKPIVRAFFQGSDISFVPRADYVPNGERLIVWGRKPIAHAIKPGVSLLRLEDGFIRSVGLGAHFVRPLSWVTDDLGIYYDASVPSRLESLLANIEFDSALVARAAALRQALCDAGITKYNVGGGAWQRPANASRVILVTGQVETDASIRFGAPAIQRNMELLKAVREANPDALVLYKPHPDVRHAVRKPGQHEHAAAAWCDQVLDDEPLASLFEQVDEVHVLTSLSGFEALMRGKKVVCYGQPFYAGWGLTTDMVPHPRRKRKRSLDELVAAALILYPTYVSKVSGHFTTPETALTELLAWRTLGPSKLPLWRRVVARILRKN